jgi:hypothetical protein
MAGAVSSLFHFTYRAADAREARALLKISSALACARKLKREGRRLKLDGRGGLMVAPPLDSQQRRRYSSVAPVLEKLLSPELKNWAEYINGASVLLERLVAAGARPREVEGELVADVPAGDMQARMAMDLYGPAVVKLLSAHAIVRAEQERVALWRRRTFAWPDGFDGRVAT